MKEILYFNGQDYFAALFDALSKARRSVYLESYIFKLDSLGQKIADNLLTIAKRGVKVSVLIDGAGSKEDARKLVQLLSPHCQIKIFHPLPWDLPRFTLGLKRLKTMFAAWFTLNTRNHRKTCVIDKHILFTGSFNITAEHLGSPCEPGWRDTGVQITNLNLKELLNAYRLSWQKTSLFEKVRNFFKAVKRNLNVRLNNTWYQRRVLQRDLLNRLRNAHQRVWITNAYFVPSSSLLKQLIQTASRQVEVIILLPSRSDLAFMSWTAQTFYRKLLNAQVKVYEYLPSILHAKTLIIDNWMLVGSSNFNHRSLLHDLELDVVITTPAAQHCLKQQFLKDLTQAKQIQLADLNQRSWYQKLIGNLLLHIRYLI